MAAEEATGPDAVLGLLEVRPAAPAAREHGMHAIWANLLDQPWPDELPTHPHRIHNLHELSDLIALLDG